MGKMINGLEYSIHADVFLPAGVRMLHVRPSGIGSRYTHPTGIEAVERAQATLHANPNDEVAYEDLACAYISQSAYCLLRDDSNGTYAALIAALDTLELMESQLGEVSTRTLVIAAALRYNSTIHASRGGASDLALDQAERMLNYLITAYPYERDGPLFQSVRDDALTLVTRDYAENVTLRRLARQVRL